MQVLTVHKTNTRYACSPLFSRTGTLHSPFSFLPSPLSQRDTLTHPEGRASHSNPYPHIIQMIFLPNTYNVIFSLLLSVPVLFNIFYCCTISICNLDSHVFLNMPSFCVSVGVIQSFCLFMSYFAFLSIWLPLGCLWAAFGLPLVSH